MMLTFKQRLQARKAIDKVLGIKSKKLKADIVPFNDNVVPVSEVVDELVKSKGTKQVLIAYIDESGCISMSCSTMKNSDLCYIGKQISLFIDDHMRGY